MNKFRSPRSKLGDNLLKQQTFFYYHKRTRFQRWLGVPMAIGFGVYLTKCDDWDKCWKLYAALAWVRSEMLGMKHDFGINFGGNWNFNFDSFLDRTQNICYRSSIYFVAIGRHRWNSISQEQQTWELVLYAVGCCLSMEINEKRAIKTSRLCQSLISEFMMHSYWINLTLRMF